MISLLLALRFMLCLWRLGLNRRIRTMHREVFWIPLVLLNSVPFLVWMDGEGRFKPQAFMHVAMLIPVSPPLLPTASHSL